MDFEKIMQLLISRFKSLDGRKNNGQVVLRNRHVIRLVLKKFALAYVLSIAQKCCLTSYVYYFGLIFRVKESFSFISYVDSVKDYLLDYFKHNKSGNAR